MNNDTTKQNCIEENSLELIKSIFKYKKESNNKPVYIVAIAHVALFALTVLTTVFFNLLDVKITFVYEFLQDLLNILGILIGFTLTALSIVGTGIFEKALALFFENKSASYNKCSSYQVILFEFIDYLYSLLITLLFAIIMLFIFPIAYFLHEYRLPVSFLFFYILFNLFKWNICSINSLIYNLYGIFMLNAQSISNKK